ncbi:MULTISPECIES: hypothetical protein [Nocardiopsis]|uniref:NADH:flavin oxidoreductase/NADH oxidase N-terminal domain-containing protein n=1 Tax=Nocardiopsis sinuspersici TaxID=501010 RepID=A0A1V3C2A2_9ACTN|nr:MULTISPECIES: hypothetical protein [Nocardiopsis]OOC54907.1 hypothetical protein NOSIN_14785 [Nocardiopsis sinuspersici]
MRRVAPPGRKVCPESLSLREREEAKVLDPATPGTGTGPEHLAPVEEGATDPVSFGGLFVSNPGLPERPAAGAELAEPDMSRAYGAEERGYTGYPALADGMVRF